MDTDIERKPKSFVKDKIVRFKPVVFLKKNLLIFSILFLFSLSLVFKVWNLYRYEILELNGKEIDQKIYLEIETYVKENILDINYFSFSPITSQRDMYAKIPQVRTIKIEKILPNKVVLFLELYEPKYVANLKSNNCYILSEEGISLEKICEENEEGCCLESSTQRNLPFLSSSSVDISLFENEKSKLLVMEDIGKVVKIIEVFKYEVSNIVLENDILEISDNGGILFRFTMADDIDTQIKRYIIVVGKIKNDGLVFKSLDLRFERPVMKE